MRRRIWGISLFLSCWLVVSVIGNSSAQTRPILNFQNRGAQYTIGREDELLIKVNIWGYVRMPGQYLVPSNTDLISLISYAGGPLDGAQLKKVKLIRVTNIPVDGKKVEEPKKIYYFNVKKFLDEGYEAANPALMPNDTIMIKGSTSETLSKVFNFLVRITPLLQAYYWYRLASR